MLTEIFDYPCVINGIYWATPSVKFMDVRGKCFFCGRGTNQYDIDYGAYYCGLDDKEIEKDIMDKKNLESFLDYTLQDMKKRDNLARSFDGGAHTFTVAPTPKPKGSPATHDQWIDDDNVTWWVHRWQRTCADNGCAIHAPSDHPMRDWPVVMNRSTLVERRCPHGSMHPDPDSARWFYENGKGWVTVHTCDGCCNVLADAPEAIEVDDLVVDAGWGDEWNGRYDRYGCPHGFHSDWDCDRCNPYGLTIDDIH